jgi:hypothetical protein
MTYQTNESIPVETLAQLLYHLDAIYAILQKEPPPSFSEIIDEIF